MVIRQELRFGPILCNFKARILYRIHSQGGSHPREQEGKGDWTCLSFRTVGPT